MAEIDFDLIKKTFSEEAYELLDNLEDTLVSLKKNGDDGHGLDTVFRIIHTLKGSAGIFDFTAFIDFNHQLENYLAQMLEQQAKIDKGFLEKMFETLDLLRELLPAELSENVTAELKKRSQELAQKITGSAAPVGANTGQVAAVSEVVQSAPETWLISLRLQSDFFYHGFDLLSFFFFLQKKVKILNAVLRSSLPGDMNDFDPEQCYLGYEVVYESASTVEEIKDVFEFIINDALVLVRKVSDFDSLEGLAEGVPEKDAEQLYSQMGLESYLKKTEQVSTETGRPDTATSTSQSLMRIDSGKLDDLIVMIGELITDNLKINEFAHSQANYDLLELTSTFSKTIEDVREKAMSLRLVQINDLFRRFHKVVRQIASERGKEVDLVISGGTTELDKQLIDRLNEPLVHLVRNAIDHGIERADERELAGKDRQAKLLLSAQHEAGAVVIEVSDDGQGIDTQSIRRKAEEKQIDTTGMSDQQLTSLIFHPGFSTAKEISEISGRGIGMSAVKQSIETMHGEIDIATRPGQGTSFKIRLPLTVAIIDGFLFRSGDLDFIVPLNMVEECIDYAIEGEDHQNLYNLRGETIPCIDINDSFKLSGHQRKSLIVIQSSRGRVGLMVDQLEGEIQIVLKPLGPLFAGLQWVSGAAVLGNGKLALVLDVVKIVDRIKEGYSERRISA